MEMLRFDLTIDELPKAWYNYSARPPRAPPEV